jgi:hypothetical protein
MRTLSEAQEARREVMKGTDSRDVTICEALMELANTIEEASLRIAEAHRETARSIDLMSDDVGRQLKGATLVR